MNFSKAINVLKNDTDFRSTVLYVTDQSIEPYYHASFDSIYSSHYLKYHVNLKLILINILREVSSDPSEIDDDYINRMILYFNKEHLVLDVTIPNYNFFSLKENNGLNITPIIAWDNNEDTQKFSCINCMDEDFFDINEAKEKMVWIITSRINPNIIYGSPTKWIINCTAIKNNAVTCQYCQSNFTLGNLPQMSANTNNWELGIRNRFTNSSNIPIGVGGNDNCLNVFPNPLTNPPNASGAYAILIPRKDITDCFKIVSYACNNPTGYHSEKAIKVDYPFIDFQNTGSSATGYVQKEGNAMTLCENYINPFVNYNENIGSCGPSTFNWRFTAAYGVYEIKRPTGNGNNQMPLYFGYPFSKGIWWGSSPDMTVLYDYEYASDICNTISGNYQQPYYGVTGCPICIDADLVLGSTSLPAKDLLVNNDPNVILNYWKQSKIQIGFVNGYSTLATGSTGKFFEYFSARLPYTCPTWNPTILLNTFSLLYGNEYEINKPISAAGAVFPANSNFYIDIKVNYIDGTSINRQECILIPVATSIITIQLFGRMKNYDAAIVNYQIKIYQ